MAEKKEKGPIHTLSHFNGSVPAKHGLLTICKASGLYLYKKTNKNSNNFTILYMLGTAVQELLPSPTDLEVLVPRQEALL